MKDAWTKIFEIRQDNVVNSAHDGELAYEVFNKISETYALSRYGWIWYSFDKEAAKNKARDLYRKHNKAMEKALLGKSKG